MAALILRLTYPIPWWKGVCKYTDFVLYPFCQEGFMLELWRIHDSGCNIQNEFTSILTFPPLEGEGIKRLDSSAAHIVCTQNDKKEILSLI
jgi:hypothetical protein